MADSTPSTTLTPRPEVAPRRGTRSPNYPYIALEVAVQRIRQLYEHEHRNAAPWTVVAQHWDYSPSSSSMDKVVGALNAYGLVEIEGAGDNRLIRLSERGLDIVEDEREVSPDRDAAIRAAALAPTVHETLWNEYRDRLPSDGTIRTFLIRQHGFNPRSADTALENYRNTIAYAKVDGTQSARDNTPKQEIKVGDYVQWNSQGVAQFAAPRRVEEIEPHGLDGAYALVEGSNTAVRVDELQRVEGYAPPVFQRPNPPVPLVINQERNGMKTETNSIGSTPGVVAALTWPDRPLKQTEFDDLKYWLDGIIRKAQRDVDKSTDDSGASKQ